MAGVGSTGIRISTKSGMVGGRSSGHKRPSSAIQLFTAVGPAASTRFRGRGSDRFALQAAPHLTNALCDEVSGWSWVERRAPEEIVA